MLENGMQKTGNLKSILQFEREVKSKFDAHSDSLLDIPLYAIWVENRNTINNMLVVMSKLVIRVVQR